MSFMQPEIIQQTVWILETDHGTEIVPVMVHDVSEEQLQQSTRDLLDGLTDDLDGLPNEGDIPSFEDLHEIELPNLLLEEFEDYIEGNRVSSGERRLLWTARLSAPGYMDATDTSTFDTEADAICDILDNYADGETSEDWEAELIDRLTEIDAERAKAYAGNLAEKVLKECDIAIDE